MRPILALMAGLIFSGVASAQTVTLRDGVGPVAEGEFLGFDGRYYRLLGPHGEVTLDGTTLTCDGAACPEIDAPPILRISGEASVLENVLPPLVETYSRRQGLDLSITKMAETTRYTLSTGRSSKLVLSLASTSSAEGLADLIADGADLAVSLRLPNAMERRLAKQAGRGDLSRPRQRTILGLDAAVPVVGDASVRGSVSPQELAAARPLHLPAGGAGDAILSILPGGRNMRTVLHPTAQSLGAAIEAEPTALGVMLFSALNTLQPVPVAGKCDGGIDAAPTTIKTEDYPLVLPVYLFSPGRRLPPAARAFLDYATSPIAQPVIRRAGLVDQFPEAIPFSEQGDRIGLAVVSAGADVGLPTLRRMVQALRNRTRLTLTFRFKGGSADLDAQSLGNVKRLAETLDRGLFDNRRLTFIGFSDSEGPAAANQRLARDRAAAVRDAVAAAAPGTAADLSVEAYGEALPMACDDTDWGKRVNRRVELWLE